MDGVDLKCARDCFEMTLQSAPKGILTIASYLQRKFKPITQLFFLFVPANYIFCNELISQNINKLEMETANFNKI